MRGTAMGHDSRPSWYRAATPPVEINKAALKTEIVDLNGRVYYKETTEIDIHSVSSNKIDSLNFIIPQEANNNVLLVRLQLSDDKNGLLSRETYTFGIKNSSSVRSDEAYLRPMLNAPQAALKLDVKYFGKVKWGDDIMGKYKAVITNTSDVPALFVQFKSDHEPQEVYFKDNYFILLPGEKRNVDILVSPGIKSIFRPTNISIDAWNLHK